MSSTENGPAPIEFKRINDVLARAKRKVPQLLFDEFWREGEVALLFGESGVGKSLLAVQIAEAIARGKPLTPLRTPRKGRTVLYIDLVLSDAQFRARYSPEGKTYKFSDDLYRESPAEGDDIVAWVKDIVSRADLSTIILDDLSALSRTNDGTRETLDVMRELRRVSRERGTSILVLVDTLTAVRGREIDERDLRRSRILCGRADSVIAMDVVDGCPEERVIFQTRSQAGEIVWTGEDNIVSCMIEDLDSGLLGFEFELPEPEFKEQALVCEIKRFHDNDGYSFRQLARNLNMSKSRVARLYGRWSKEFEEKVEAERTRRMRNS